MSFISNTFRDFKGRYAMVDRRIALGILIILGIVAVATTVASTVLLTEEDHKATMVEDAADADDADGDDAITGKDPKTSKDATAKIQDKLNEIEEKNMKNDYTPKEREWISSGPFQIDRTEYILGEKVFLRIGGLQFEEKGQVTFLRPLNDTHYSVYATIPFDGASKPAFNYYIEPRLSLSKEICTLEELTGIWLVDFRGTDHPSLKFKVTGQILPGDEENYEPIC